MMLCLMICGLILLVCCLFFAPPILMLIFFLIMIICIPGNVKVKTSKMD